MAELTIDAHRLSKDFCIESQRPRYVTLRDSMVEIGKAPVQALKNVFHTGREVATALDDVSFQVREGEAVAIIGRNGAGKSTLLKVLSRIMEPTRGYVDVYARVGTLLEVGTGFHHELSGRENIYLNGAILGMRKSEIDSSFDEIVDFAGVERFIDTPVKRYSTGMHMRLAFAVAAHLRTEILLVDEVLAVGDAEFQKKCLGKLEDVASEGRTVLFVSHNMGAVRNLCNKGIVLDQGRLTAEGEIDECIEAYYRSIGALGGGSASTGDDQASRSLFGPITINGSQDNTITQSDGFEVSTQLNLGGRSDAFSVYCQVEDMHGRVICRLREESGNLAGQGGVADSNGRQTVKVRFPPLWLNVGLHSVDFVVDFQTEFTSSERVQSDKFPLDVIGTHSPSDKQMHITPILHPDVSWSMDASLAVT